MAQTGTEVNRYVIAITGASGMIYARELLAYFAGRPDLELHAIISAAGEQVLGLELGLTPADTGPRGRLAPGGRLHRAPGQRLFSGPGHGGHSLLHGQPGGHRPGGRAAT